MNNLNDVHTVAERYLRDLETGKCSFYSTPACTDVAPLGESVSDRVVVMRDEAPNYLVGIKANGLAVFTHDLKLASSYDSASLKLIDALTQLKRQRIPVETMPACWFSNHQRDSA
jgi:hypothetical protein